MAWMYIFDEGDARTCKIGSARDHYHDRFRDQQPCNPRTLHLRAAIWFDTAEDMKACEALWKSGKVCDKADPDQRHREWYRIGWREAARHPVWRRFGGREVPLVPFRGTFRDDLNEGTRDRQGRGFHLMAYLLEEEGDRAVGKLRFTAYGWKGVAQHYRTGNPHRVEIAGRWVWPDNVAAERARDRLVRELQPHAIHFGWYRLPPAQLAERIGRAGGAPFPPVDGRDVPDLTSHWSAARFELGDARVQAAVAASVSG